jgi:hypothetical protein
MCLVCLTRIRWQEARDGGQGKTTIALEQHVVKCPEGILLVRIDLGTMLATDLGDSAFLG